MLFRLSTQITLIAVSIGFFSVLGPTTSYKVLNDLGNLTYTLLTTQVSITLFQVLLMVSSIVAYLSSCTLVLNRVSMIDSANEAKVNLRRQIEDSFIENLALREQLKTALSDTIALKKKLKISDYTNLNLKMQLRSLSVKLDAVSLAFANQQSQFANKAINIANRIRESPSNHVVVLKPTDEVLPLYSNPIVVPTRLPSITRREYPVIDRLFVLGVRHYRTSLNTLDIQSLINHLVTQIQRSVEQHYPATSRNIPTTYLSHPVSGRGLTLAVSNWPFQPSSPAINGPMFP